MRTVENTYLALLVGRYVIHYDDGKTSLFKRELLLNGLWPFNDPCGKNLTRINDVVLVAELLTELLCFGTGIPGDDAIHQRGTEEIIGFDPRGKFLLQPPEINVLLYTFFQFIAVVVDQLAGQDDKALKSELPALIEQQSKLCGEAGGRSIVRFAGRIISNAGLRGIGSDKTKLRIFGAGEVFLKLLGDIQAAGNTGDDAPALHSFPVLPAAQKQRIQPVLWGETGVEAGGGGLRQHNFCVEPGLLVHNVNEIINKGAQEVSFSKLQHAFRGVFQQITGIALLFQSLIRQSFHRGSPSDQKDIYSIDKMPRLGQSEIREKDVKKPGRKPRNANPVTMQKMK